MSPARIQADAVGELNRVTHVLACVFNRKAAQRKIARCHRLDAVVAYGKAVGRSLGQDLEQQWLRDTRALADRSGLGQCGTCVVEVLEGARNLSPRSDVEEVYLADRPASYRLSCRTTVNGDVTVRTRPSEGVGKGSNSLVGALKALVGRG